MFKCARRVYYKSGCVTSRSITIQEVVHDNKLFEIKLEQIRNFSIIAHVDHGKSTLADCLLQMTGNINDKDRLRGQVLDTLKVERDRGITVKAQTASMIFNDKRTGITYLMNLIDTPGHIDFSFEVSRSLASCQGALLLVDSSQSIQAQTLGNYEKAKKLGLTIIPVVTKIDLPTSQPEETALLMGTTFGIDPDRVVMTSAKKMIGIQQLLETIVDTLPPPTTNGSRSDVTDDKSYSSPFLGRIVDSWFDEHRGVVCLIQATSGELKEGQRISTYASMRVTKEIDTRTDFSVQEIGLLTPTQLRTGMLACGQVGYVIAGLRSTKQAQSGDTMFVPGDWSKKAEADFVPLSGYEVVKPMLYASIFPVDSTELEALYAAVDRLCLNDSSITVTRDQSSSLGSGLRCGFLGFLHMEVFNQRLSDEFNMDIVTTTPSVPYVIEYADGIREEISNISLWPKGSEKVKMYRVLEPMVRILLVTPHESYGAMVDIIKQRRGSDLDVTHMEDGHVRILCEVPWQEVVVDMHDAVKNASSGYASFNYDDAGYKQSDLVKVEVSVNGEACDPLSFIAHSSNATANGRKTLLKLKEVVDRQQFEIVLQAKIDSKVLARERIAPYRKDVLVTKAGKAVGGGDISRKKKLLEKQKEGKKRAKMVGRVEIGQEAFWAVLQR